jgi:hypothetical protein
MGDHELPEFKMSGKEKGLWGIAGSKDREVERVKPL